MPSKFRLLAVLLSLLVGAGGTLLIARGGGQDAGGATGTTVAPAPTPPSIQGPRVKLGDLLYNVTDVRILKRNRPSDAPYVVNLQKAPPGNAYLGVFVRIYNLSAKTQTSAPGYLLEPSRSPGNAVMNQSSESPYQLAIGAPVAAGGQLPVPGSAAAEGKIPGGLVLYRINADVTSNQPLDLVLNTAAGQLAKVRLPPVPQLTAGGH
jgi:hypothetical protein